MIQEQEHISVFSLINLVRFYLSNVWSAVSSHDDHSYQNSIIFRCPENRYLQNVMVCHRSKSYVVFFKKVVNKACCF